MLMCGMMSSLSLVSSSLDVLLSIVVINELIRGVLKTYMGIIENA